MTSDEQVITHVKTVLRKRMKMNENKLGIVARLRNEETISDAPLRESMELRKEAADLIEDLVTALKLAEKAMNHMGDVLNGHDMALPEDVEATTPAFNAVRAALSKAGASQ